MGVGSRLSNELQTWGGLAITLVVIMIILSKFKTVSGNTTTTNSTVDLFVSGLSEPANWVDIFVIALVGFGIIMYIKKKNK